MPKQIGNLAEGLLFVVSAPAGTGKTTLVRLLTQKFRCIVESVSCTTRAPRIGEVPGTDYFFLTEEEFRQKELQGDFLETAQVFGHYYGTSKEFVDAKRKQGNHVVLVIDTQGALRLQSMQVDATYIFIAPPDFEVLEQRLLGRKTESLSQSKERLSWAQKEMDVAERYDFLVVNSDLQVALDVLASIIIAEEHRIKHIPLKGKAIQ